MKSIDLWNQDANRPYTNKKIMVKRQKSRIKDSGGMEHHLQSTERTQVTAWKSGQLCHPSKVIVKQKNH